MMAADLIACRGQTRIDSLAGLPNAIIHRPDCLRWNSCFDLPFSSIFHGVRIMDTVWNELREVVWLVSMITGLSIASVSLAIALATA